MKEAPPPSHPCENFPRRRLPFWHIGIKKAAIRGLCRGNSLSGAAVFSDLRGQSPCFAAAVSYRFVFTLRPRSISTA